LGNEALEKISGIPRMMEEIARRLGEARQDTLELAHIVGRLWDLARDAERVSRFDPDFIESFNELRLEYYDGKLTILTPRAGVEVGVISDDCVMSKPVIECVKQHVAASKAEMIARVLGSLSRELSDYFDEIMELIQKTFMKISDLESQVKDASMQRWGE
jgi:hypothetical protein